jgi:predicted dehydrogenase
MSDSFESCTRMIEACRAAGVPFFVHGNFRWQTPMREVKKAIQEGRIGTVVRGRIQLFTGGAISFQVQPYLSLIADPALQDMGPHVLDLCRFLFGEIRSVCAQTKRTVAGITGDDMAVILADASGVPVTCVVCTFCDNRVFVEGEKGTIVLGNDEVLTITSADGTVEVRDPRAWPRYAFCSDEDWQLHGASSIHSIVLCNRSFADAFRNGTLPETSGKDNYQTMRAVFAGIRSAHENRKVFLDELR